MRKEILKSFVIVVLFLMFLDPANANVIFEENFNSQSDWQPKPAGIENDSLTGGTATHDFTDATDTYNTPSNWNYFRSTGVW